ncbi:MAG: argininosuccinate lyase [Candidatus Bathyarchaeota archaeon]|nr:argininosuccinate lyase [Candidatus Bathyarchaeota archaeon]
MSDSSGRGEARGERFGRARKPTAPEILEAREKRSRPTPLGVDSYYCQALIHRAHVVMLAERGILSMEESARILEGVKEVESDAEEDERLTSYMATEAALIGRVGEVGGRMHTGRSRNDLAQTQRRMYYRDRIEELIGAVLGLQKALLAVAKENLETVMSGYTHWRQAQPVTLGHYLVAHADAASRSLERLEEVYKRTNLNTLGSAAVAGTGWPVDRRRTMELLGFDGLLENSYDCVAAHDHVVELASAIAIHMTNLSRLADDLQIWSSDEFGMIDLDEAYAGTSSIMPQKKNPSSLEMVKGFASEAIGALMMTISSVKGVSYTNLGDRMPLEPVTIDTAVGATKVMAGVVSTLTPMREKMLFYARGFSTMTELADTLVRNHGLSFRQAHDVIASTTSRAISEGKTVDQITIDMVEEAALEGIGRELGISEEELRLAVNPIENVRRRKVVGGPAPEEVKRMIDDRRSKVDLEESRHRERQENLEKAYKRLAAAEKTIKTSLTSA